MFSSQDEDRDCERKGRSGVSGGTGELLEVETRGGRRRDEPSATPERKEEGREEKIKRVQSSENLGEDCKELTNTNEHSVGGNIYLVVQDLPLGC